MHTSFRDFVKHYRADLLRKLLRYVPLVCRIALPANNN